MAEETEIERFFAAYSSKQKMRVEMSPEYQIAVKRGKITTALEIASVIISYSESGNYRQKRRDIGLIFKKEFPEIDIPN